ncbi:MAG: hypothetical protein ACTSPQ_03870 [Candidatus Helarchaeota archaeon]
MNISNPSDSKANESESVDTIDHEDQAVKNMITGGTTLIITGMIVGLFGWLTTIFVSRPDIGIGASGYAILGTANSMIIILGAISGGINQSISKFIAEKLVDSKDSALEYAKGSSLATNLFGLGMFIIFSLMSLIFYLNMSETYALIFLFVGISLFMVFFRDNLIGNLAGLQKFKTIGIINLVSIIGGVSMALSIYYIPYPYNRITFLAQVFTLPLSQIIAALIYGHKLFPYGVLNIYKLPKSFEIPKRISSYGLYCTIPQLILSGSIFWIQTMYYQMFFGPNDPVVGISAIVIGYAAVAGAISFYGWPQIPAVAEAKAMKNQTLIDKLVSQCYKTGFNVSITLLVFYVGLAHPILELFHTAEYLPGYVPFILLSFATTFIGLVFLIASMMIGLGLAKKAFIYIFILIITAFIITPLLIILFTGLGNKYLVLLAGPLGLMIPTLIILPLMFKYLPKYTNKTSKFYLMILIKGFLSVAAANITSYIIENYVYPYNTFWNGIPTGFLLGIVVNLSIFILLMCFLSALDDQDWELFNSMLGPLKFMTIIPRWISKNSPFYKKREDYNKENAENKK